MRDAMKSHHLCSLVIQLDRERADIGLLLRHGPERPLALLPSPVGRETCRLVDIIKKGYRGGIPGEGRAVWYCMNLGVGAAGDERDRLFRQLDLCSEMARWAVLEMTSVADAFDYCRVQVDEWRRNNRGIAKVEPIRAGHPVHTAVMFIQSFYKGGTLPRRGSALRRWRNLLGGSRSNHVASYVRASRFLRWIVAEGKRVRKEAVPFS